MNQTKQQFQINTHLKEIYPTEQIDEKYEPLYEELRSRYKSIYNSQEPAIFIQVPYSITLFGDHITQLFSEKVISNINLDLIICLSSSSTLELNVRYFDHAGLTIKLPIEKSLLFKPEKENTTTDYITFGYISALQYIKNKNQAKGANVLILFNTSNIQEKDIQLSAYLGMMISSLLINNSLPSKDEVYQMCLLEISKLCNMSYYSSYIYHKLFLKNQSIGSNISTSFSQIEIDKKLSCLIFDSFSAVPISYYSNSNYWNKRLIEVRLGIALIFKRFKDSTTIEEIALYSKDIREFIRLFDDNIQTIFEMIDIYLKTGHYSLSELKEELGYDLKQIIGDVDFYEGVLMTKKFNLHKRLMYIFTEYQEIVKLNYQIDKGDKIDWIKEINDSCANMINYECFSDEISGVLRGLKKKYPQIGFKLISKGWSGNCIALGYTSDIKQLETEIIELYEQKNEDIQDNLITAWISDDITHYCYRTPLGNHISILNPKYEDFMLEFVDKKLNLDEMNKDISNSTNNQTNDTN